MKHGSLFSGIGGFDLAAQWMGWENVFHCEIDPFCRRILHYHWPNTITYENIKTTDFTIHRGTIDILSGGFPCQPYSAAGKRKGTEDDRHLWPEMLRAIREVQPRWVVGENVRGLTNWNGGLVFDQVQADLEGEGYEVTPFLLPACAVNAPHRRDRIWFVAKNTLCDGCDERGTYKEGASVRQQRDVGAGGSDGLHLSEGATPDTGLLGQEKCEKQTTGTEQCNKGATMHTDSTIEQGEYIRQKREGEFNGPDSRDGFYHFQNFPTQSPVCGGNDGIPRELDGITFPKWRNESIKAYGNAVVPQVVYQIFKAIQEYEEKVRANEFTD